MMNGRISEQEAINFLREQRNYWEGQAATLKKSRVDSDLYEWAQLQADTCGRIIVLLREHGGVNQLGLTATQRDCKNYIADYITREGIVPSYDEIQLALGLSSKSGVSRIIDQLVQRGHAVKEYGRVRSLKIIPTKGF